MEGKCEYECKDVSIFGMDHRLISCSLGLAPSNTLIPQISNDMTSHILKVFPIHIVKGVKRNANQDLKVRRFFLLYYTTWMTAYC